MAFAGNREELAKKMDISHGLLEKLLDRQIITRRHYEVIQVLCTCLWLFAMYIGDIHLLAAAHCHYTVGHWE